jgi:GDP-4-dehydro-6-deoxy-D-mannose reductase
MTKRILVTGAEGFVGKRLCAFLEKSGHAVLRAHARIIDATDASIETDISDLDSVTRLFQWAGNVDAVVHLAAITFVPEAQANPTRVMDVNFHGTQNIIHEMEARLPEARLLFVSTSEVYGPPKYLPVDEDHPINPQNPYAKSKAAADDYCEMIFESKGLDIVRMRPFNHSGPRQADSFVLSSFARQIAEMESGSQESIMRVGNLEAARDFMHVDDVIRAYALALDKGEAGAVYNLCSGDSRPIQSALDGLLSLSDLDVQIQIDPDRMRPSEVAEIRGSHELFTSKTGWNPENTFDQLLAELLDYWRAYILHKVATS